ncbi:MAG: hypothetical protein Q9170_003170 [Blastenia crenularia]
MKYRPLDRSRDEIRLLEILPGRSNNDQQSDVWSNAHESDREDLVECQLNHYIFEKTHSATSLVDQSYSYKQSALDWNHDYAAPAMQEPIKWRYPWGDFVALSYAWGDHNITREVLINGDRAVLGRNLESALRVLRDKQPVKTGYKIWIDALSINQQDVHERDQEVKRMHRIYKEAYAVAVWLGPEADESNKAMRLVRILSQACEIGTDQNLGDSLRQHPEFLGEGSWSALSQLLGRTYWNRLWILQEVALGGNQTAILCGLEAVTWQQLYNAVYLFGTHNIDIMFSLIDRETRAVGIPNSGLNRNRIIHLNDEQKVQDGEAEEQVMCMLDLGRKSLSVDPRDKVYGLLGMMKESVVSRIKVDYHADLSEVYTAFARAFIVADDSLEILEQCSWHGSDLPSWVPDWTDMDHYRLFSGRSNYHATKGLTMQCRFVVDQYEILSLCTKALKIDEIDGLGFSYYEQLLSSTKPTDEMTQSVQHLNRYTSERGLQEAVWRTLVGNRTPTGKNAPDNYRFLLDCVPETGDSAGKSWRGLRAFSRLVNQSADLYIAGKSLHSFFPGDRTVLKNPRVAQEAMEQMFRYLRTRRLITTSTGFLGIAPHASQKADCVVLIPGCNVPLLLRPMGEQRYKMVGSCYLHGFMEGEAIDRSSPGELHFEQVVLV